MPPTAHRIRRARNAAALASAALLLMAPATIAAPQKATPIENTGPAPSTPPYIGSAAHAHPVKGVRPAWQDPFMARNPTNSVHNDAWQTDVYTQFSGPLGSSPETLSTSIGRTCITLTFDRKGRLIGSCTNLPDGPGLYLLDPVTLDTLAFMQLPYVPPPAGTNPALNTTGGAYFYLDNKGRVVLAASNRQILVVTVDDSGAEPQFKQVGSHDPTTCLQPDERMPSALPDTKGRIWFVGRQKGTVGVIDTKTGKCGSALLNEEIENSFAIATDGIYIVSDKSMYKFRAGANLKPKVVWKAKYRNSGVQKPGQINAGSGTTPTLLWPSRKRGRSTAPGYVAITDNADPMDVVVYRAGDRLARRQKRVVCTVPVFQKGASDTENSLTGMGRSLYVENNYGYDLQKWNDVLPGPAGPFPIGGDRSLVSEPGVARIDIKADGSGCRKVWTSTEVRAPSVVPKGNARNGLLYFYENLKDEQVPDSDPWYWTAVDRRTGKVVWKRLAGYGGLYNNHYAGIALGRNPASGKTTLYLGGVGGIMALRDGS
jgi:hypothetical protein